MSPNSEIDSIEKFDAYSDVEGELIPYCQVNTKVIQKINNPLALAVWVYLLSKPKTFEIIKSHLKNHFRLSNKDIKEVFAYLNDHWLVEYKRFRNALGQLGKIKIKILNGSRFQEHPTEEHRIVIINNDLSISQASGSKSTGVDIHTTGKHTTIKNRKRINKEKAKIKDKRYTKNNKKKDLCPLDFKPNEKHYAIAKQLGINADEEAQAIVDWSHANGEKKLDWHRAFNNWLRNSNNYKRGAKSNGKTDKYGIMFETCRGTYEELANQNSANELRAIPSSQTD